MSGKPAIVLLFAGLLILSVSISALMSAGANSQVVISPHGKLGSSLDPDSFLTKFEYGRVTALPNGTIMREFTLIALDKTIEIAPGVFFSAWTFNGTVPGPTIRATEGDKVHIIFYNHGSHMHTIHLHGVHPSEVDGVQPLVNPGGRFDYTFTAGPFGLFLYHCHAPPLTVHISKGLYGAFIIDPSGGRPLAREMVMVMNGYDTDFDKENEFYTVNGIAFYYMHHPVKIKLGESVRVYLLNMLEFDLINSFHLHANIFRLYRTGTNLTSYEITDIVTLSQAERAILEFTYDYPGSYMFHAHQTEFADLGWVGLFEVTS